MGSLTTFLGLCLLVSDGLLSIISPWEVKTLTGATTDGAAIFLSNMNWSWDVPFPSQGWYVSSWIQIKAQTANTARLLQFVGFNGPNPVICYVTWPSDAPPTFTFGTISTIIHASFQFRQENVWFYVQIGLPYNSDISLGTFLSRHGSYVTQLGPHVTMEARRTSQFIAPANANPFNVSSK